MSVSTVHPHYDDYRETWRALRDAYVGSGAVKTTPDLRKEIRGVKLNGTRYLPRPNGMRRDEQYSAYRDRAAWYGATERAVHGLTGTVFRHEPQLQAPASLTPHLEDVTQTGVPLRSFAERVVRETLLLGRFGILVDFPPATPLPDEPGVFMPPIAARPYWVGYQAEEIINWRTTQREGDTILSLVVLKECVSEPQGFWGNDDFFKVVDRTQYRVLRLNEAGQYEVSLWVERPERQGTRVLDFMLKALWVPEREGLPLDYIPFVFLAPFSLEPHIEKSLMEALVEVNYRHYRHSADYEHGLHMTALPTAYVCATSDAPGELAIGSAEAWWIADNQAKVGMLEFHGQGLQSHERAMEQDIKDMASLGARLLEGAPSVSETEVAAQARTQAGESPIQTLVTTVSQGLTQALQIHAWWAGLTNTPDDIAVTYVLNKDLVAAQAEPALLKVLMEMLLNGTISYETFYFNLQRGEIARPMIPVEEEQALLEVRQEMLPLATMPTNGAVRQNGATRPAA